MANVLTLICDQCGKTFERPAHRVRGKKSNFCSKGCFWLKHSPVVRAHPELLGSRDLITRECLVCRAPFTFKPRRILTAHYCSRRCQLVGGILPDYRGPANPNYKHGQSRSAAYQLMNRWIDKCCAICGWDISVDIHHIVPIRAGGKNTDENLILLCPNHHRMAEMGLLDREKMHEVALRLLRENRVVGGARPAS